MELTDQEKNLMVSTVELTRDEMKLMMRVYPNAQRLTILRSSEREYDLFVGGEGFRAWLPLSAIGAASWTQNPIWKHSNAYGSKGYIPPQGHDWSGIRDSTRSAVWTMFAVALKELNR